MTIQRLLYAAFSKYKRCCAIGCGFIIIPLSFSVQMSTYFVLISMSYFIDKLEVFEQKEQSLNAPRCTKYKEELEELKQTLSAEDFDRVQLLTFNRFNFINQIKQK